MKFWGTPAGAGMLVGIVMAVVSLFGLVPVILEDYFAYAILVGFAFWLSRWVRYRVFAPAIWLGLFIAVWVPILHTAFLPIYLANHPDWAGATTRAAFLGGALLRVAVFTLLLAALSSLLAIGPRRRDQARMAADMGKEAEPGV